MKKVASQPSGILGMMAPLHRVSGDWRTALTDIVMKDIDPVLADRIRRVAEARGWSMHDTLFHLLEQGLFVTEAEVRSGFNDREVDVLSAAITALKDVPRGHGF